MSYYYVDVRCEALHTVKVKADSKSEARRKAVAYQDSEGVQFELTKRLSAVGGALEELPVPEININEPIVVKAPSQ